MRITFDLNLRKNKSDLELVMELRALNPWTWTIYSYGALYAWVRWHKDLIITSMHRDDGSIHAYNRAADIDVDEKAVYQGLLPAEALELRDAVNGLFEYDPARPEFNVAVYGDNDPANKHWNHIHLQAHPNTTTKRAELA